MLDVATGPGYAAALAAERGAEVVAVDLSREMLDLAAELHPEIEFRQADANALPFEDATFDAVVSNLLMPHVSDLPALAGELLGRQAPVGLPFKHVASLMPDALGLPPRTGMTGRRLS